MSASEITRVIRKPACDGEWCFRPCCMRPATTRELSTCRHNNPRTQCPECEHARRMFAAIPTRSRALVGNGGTR